MQPYFFFSYARRDRRQDTDAFIDRFHDDLCAELGRLEPAARAETSYRDTDRLILGDDWERELAAVLARCRTMVALYSPAYFASKYCGKEWTAFHGRVRRHHELTGSLVPALIPVLWEPPSVELPGEVAAIQYVEPAMSEPYARYGLRHLLRTDPTGEDYRRVVRVVAGRIKDAAARQLTELPMFDLGAIRGYFPPGSRWARWPGSRRAWSGCSSPRAPQPRPPQPRPQQPLTAAVGTERSPGTGRPTIRRPHPVSPPGPSR